MAYIIGRFNGQYVKENDEKDEKLNLSHFYVDELIAPLIQKLINSGIITYYSCSGHISDSDNSYTHDCPYIVIDGWKPEVIDRLNEKLKERSFNEMFVKYVRDISFMTVGVDKEIYNEYFYQCSQQDCAFNKISEPIADIESKDGILEEYLIPTTGLYFKGFEQFCGESGFKPENEPYDNLEYLIGLWKWFDQEFLPLIKT